MSSIEEDIKRCEQLTRPEHASWIGLSNQNAIKTLLCNLEALCDMQRSADRELQRQKQINEEHQKINGELREKVKELEKENRIFALEGSKVRLSLYIKENYIPRQNIKNKFEKIQLLYENNLKEVDLKEVQKVDGKIFEGIRLEAQRDLTRELLQESEGNNEKIQ